MGREAKRGYGDMKKVALKVFANNEGKLIAFELHKWNKCGGPFEAKRVFIIKNVPEDGKRGNHAHKKCHQYLVCLCAEFYLRAFNTKGEKIFDEYILENEAIHVPPMTWLYLDNFRLNTIVAVFASEHYDTSDYIEDWDEFTKKCNPV